MESRNQDGDSIIDPTQNECYDLSEEMCDFLLYFHRQFSRQFAAPQFVGKFVAIHKFATNLPSIPEKVALLGVKPSTRILPKCALWGLELNVRSWLYVFRTCRPPQSDSQIFWLSHWGKSFSYVRCRKSEQTRGRCGSGGKMPRRASNGWNVISRFTSAWNVIERIFTSNRVSRLFRNQS